MLDFTKRFANEQSGLEMVEWAVVAGLLTTTAAITMRLLGTFLNFRLTEVWATLAFIP